MEQSFSAAQRQFIEESMDNPKILTWLSKFLPGNAESFLAKYHAERAIWMQQGGQFLKSHQEWLTIHHRRAETALFYIQQKKLFDLQCQWRAELVTVEGVEYSAQFLALEESIHSLDFLPPITQEEVNLLKEWLLDYKWSRNLYSPDGWQNYRYFVRNNRECPVTQVPSYYKYVDRSNKIESLWRVLPDIRGDKELKYEIAAMEARMSHAPERADRVQEDDPRPRLWEFGETFVEFSQLFEGREVNECRIALAEFRKGSDDRELQFAIESLHNAKEPVALLPHANWREGILYTAWKYERDHLVAALDGAYADYLFRRQMGIAYAKGQHRSIIRIDPAKYGEEILDGREALGEPRDFNF